MRTPRILAVGALAFSLAGCTHREAERVESGPDTAGRKAGRAAYDLAEETKRAAKVAGKKLKETGHELREGWKEAKQDAKESGRK